MREATYFEQVVSKGCGLDVHKETVVAPVCSRNQVKSALSTPNSKDITARRNSECSYSTEPAKPG